MKSEIDKFKKAVPFVPFDIELVCGRIVHVPHPEFLLVPPGKGLYIGVSDEDGVVEVLNAIMVIAVRPSRARRRKAG